MNIKRHRRMTKHRKGTTKHRKSIRNRKCKTRRQSGGGYVSFISADENIIRGQKGIDVKVSTERHTNGTPMWWLIGGDGWSDATFGQLKSGAKGGRYEELITILELDKEFGPNMFTKFTGDFNTSKGISLNVDQFCRLLINGPLDYPKLRERFNSAFRCTGSAAPSSAAQAQYDSNLQTIKDLGMNVTDGEIEKALKKANGNVDNAASILLVRPSGSTAPRQKPPPFTPLSDIGMGGIASGAPRQLHDWPPPPPSSAYHPPSSAYHPPPSAYHPPPGALAPQQQRQRPPPFTPLSDIGMGGIASGAPRQLHDWPPPY